MGCASHTHMLTEEFHLQPVTQCICPDGLTDPIRMILIVKSMKNNFNMLEYLFQTVCMSYADAKLEYDYQYTCLQVGGEG